ncbi:MAG: hypothetical protein WC661_03575 [Opitutaceae bacterium]|jgi:hypothetical protein
MSRIVVHIPPHCTNRDLPTVGAFYHRMILALRSAGHFVVLREGRGPEAERHDLNICYHTHLDAADVLNVKIGYLPEFFYFDEGGYSGWARLAGDFSRVPSSSPTAATFQRGLVERYVHGRVTKYAQRPTPPPPLDDFVLIITQVQGDSVLELARFSSREMVTSVLAAAAEAGRPSVIKTHPLCRDDDFAAFVRAEASRHGAVISDSHIHDLLPRAPGGVDQFRGGFRGVAAWTPGIELRRQRLRSGDPSGARSGGGAVSRGGPPQR